MIGWHLSYHMTGNDQYFTDFESQGREGRGKEGRGKEGKGREVKGNCSGT